MAKILSLLSRYPLLEQLAHYVSTADLIHLALTCSESYFLIRPSKSTFDSLKRLALCDGRGLKMRQEFQGVYSIPDQYWVRGRKYRRAAFDEEIEVRVWNLKCDATNAFPCLQCNVNICEECRYVPRVRDGFGGEPIPHLRDSYETQNIICYCTACDANVEHDLPERLSEFCDCNQYTRWICVSCKIAEWKANSYYYRTRTEEVDIRVGFAAPHQEIPHFGQQKHDERDHYEYMLLPCHQLDRTFCCPCGKQAPRHGNVRCAWCRRRHNLSNWWSFTPGSRPFFDQDPCYPKLHGDVYASDYESDQTYPDLGYRGPIAP